MAKSIGRPVEQGLGRLCADGDGDRIIAAPALDGIERIEGRFSGAAYGPHRHDTYAIGVTLHGVQSFRYRGRTRHSLPGQVMVLHPDEMHLLLDLGVDGIMTDRPGVLREVLASRGAWFGPERTDV